MLRLLPFSLLLLLACSEDGLPLDPTDASQPDTTILDLGSEDFGIPDQGVEDQGLQDLGAPDLGMLRDVGGPIDMGEPADMGTPIICAQLQRDVCLATLGCVLHGSDEDGGYFCRDAISDCERQKDRMGCEASGQCIFSQDACYCPEGAVCACGGGPARICRDVCEGKAGAVCPGGYFCDTIPRPQAPLCEWAADELGMCIRTPDTCPNFGQSVCGCPSDNMPMTLSNDCVRRMQNVRWGQFGACPP